ncbi:MarR family winged helix-turn-helix transcriptional regulator [Pontibacter vulgaris]|uniref:MarR family winged helix-turn-helix transcriptional regulator n=1 Tax=Pontibacter vulgaris TaxID=2905679 RepID=UPI001FA7B56B|nr:MarR family transcriptional regulator [Pontibacter vulgaris]
MPLENEIGLSSFRNEWQKASMSVLYTHGFLYNGYESFFKKHQVTSQQFNVLRILLEQFPRPVSTSFLRDKMLDKMSDASRLVSRLHAKGLVEVTQNLKDKRLVNIVISAKGQQLVSQVDSDIYNLDALVQGLTEDEAMQLTDLLTKVRQSIKTVHERISTPEQV